MATHELNKILSDPITEPLSAQWFLDHFPPELMAAMLFSLWEQHGETMATLLQESWKFGKPKIAGSVQATRLVAELPALVRRHNAGKGGNKSKANYRELAERTKPFWMSDRYRFPNNIDWAGKAIQQKDFILFVQEHKMSTPTLEVVAQWPRKYGWDALAKKKSVN